MDGVILFRVVQVLKSCGDHILCFPEDVEILHFVVTVGLKSVIEEFGLHPAGIHGHHSDAPGFQFPIHGPAVAEHEGLGCTVGGYVRHRLESGQTVQLQDMAALLHIGQYQPGHKNQSLAVQIDHLAIVFQGDFMVAAEFAEACGIDQKLDIGLFDFQQGPESIKAFVFAKVQTNAAQRHRNLAFQCFQGSSASGDDPDLIHADIIG